MFYANREPPIFLGAGSVERCSDNDSHCVCGRASNIVCINASFTSENNGQALWNIVVSRGATIETRNRGRCKRKTQAAREETKANANSMKVKGKQTRTYSFRTHASYDCAQSQCELVRSCGHRSCSLTIRVSQSQSHIDTDEYWGRCEWVFGFFGFGLRCHEPYEICFGCRPVTRSRIIQ